MFRFAFRQPLGFDLFVKAAQPFLIEQALAIVQQCNDHTGKRSRLSARIVELVSG